MTEQGRLSILKMERDCLLRKIWLVFRQMSDIEKLNMSDEDLNIWTLVTNHSSNQKILSEQIKKDAVEGG